MADIEAKKPKRKPPLDFYSKAINADYEAKFAKWLPAMKALGYEYEAAEHTGMMIFGGWFTRPLGETGMQVQVTCVTDGEEPEEIGMWFGEVQDCAGAVGVNAFSGSDPLTTPMNAHTIITRRLRKWLGDVTEALGPEEKP